MLCLNAPTHRSNDLLQWQQRPVQKKCHAPLSVTCFFPHSKKAHNNTLHQRYSKIIPKHPALTNTVTKNRKTAKHNDRSVRIQSGISQNALLLSITTIKKSLATTRFQPRKFRYQNYPKRSPGKCPAMMPFQPQEEYASQYTSSIREKASGALLSRTLFSDHQIHHWQSTLCSSMRKMNRRKRFICTKDLSPASALFTPCFYH